MMTDRLDTERTIPGGASESETCQLQSGDTLGHFTIDKLLGRGGMGEVYLARHTELGTQHAIKLMLGGFAQVPGFQEKFLNEARIMAKLKHPAIVHVTDFGRARGMSYLVMDYVDGPTGPAKNLRQHMDEQAIKGNVLQEEDAVAVGLTLCKALAYAHSYKDADVPNGVVHRDLKPANILIGRDMRLYITDFGLAQLIGPGFNRSIVAQANTAGRSIGAQQTIAGSTRASGTGSAEGTLDYMSPEQREGRPAEAPSDVYAMGAILYELLTGRKSVFSRDAPDKVRPGLNPGWAGLLERCLAYNPEQRFQNATELQTAILNLTSAPKTEAPGPSATKLKRLIVRAAPSAKSPASATSANAAPLSIPKHKLKGLAVPAIAILIIVIAGIFFVRARTQAPARNAGKSQTPLAIVKPNTIPPSPSTPEQLAPKPVTPNHLTAESSGLPNVHKQIVQEPKISDNQLSEHESTTATPERNISLQHNLPGEALPDSRSNSNTAGFNDNKSSETGQLNLKIGEVLSGIGRNGDISSDVKVSVKDPALAALASHPFDSSSLANLKSILTSETNMERRCKLTIVYYAGCLATSMTDEADKSRSYLDRTFPQSALSEIQSSNFSDSCPACKAGTITSPCQDCKETGSCHKCGGNGISIIKGFDGRRLTCISCNGTGKCRKCKGSAVANNPCIKCGGSGQALSLEKVRGKYLELLNSLAPGPATSTTVSTTAEKAEHLALLEKNVVIGYICDDKDGATVRDIGPYGNNGQMMGATFKTIGGSRRAYAFDTLAKDGSEPSRGGKHAYLYLGTRVEGFPLDDFSISIYFCSKNDGVLIGSAQNELWFREWSVSPKGFSWTWVAGHSSGAVGRLGKQLSITTELEKWNHVCITRKGKVVCVYVNGRMQANSDQFPDDLMPVYSHGLMIGNMKCDAKGYFGSAPRDFTSWKPYKGMIESVLVLSRAISEKEVCVLDKFYLNRSSEL